MATAESFWEEDAYRADLLSDGDETVPESASWITGCLDWEEAKAAGMHVVGGFPATQTGDHYHNVYNGSRHSSTIAGMLRAGADIVQIEGIQDRPV